LLLLTTKKKQDIMGRMKEVYIELQNQYGEDLENAPKDFSMENHLKELVESEENTDEDNK